MLKLSINSDHYVLPDSQVVRLFVDTTKSPQIILVKTRTKGDVPLSHALNIVRILEGGGERCGDVALVLEGDESYCTFVHSVDGKGKTVASGPWPRSETRRGDISTFVLPPGWDVHFRVVMVSKMGDDVLFIDPIVRNGTHAGGGPERHP